MVCIAALTEILHVSKTRLQRIARQFHVEGCVSKKRGGVRLSRKQKYDTQEHNIREFISKLYVTDSHYCHSKTERKYLSSDLSIKKLYRMYSEWTTLEEKPKTSYFQYIFTTKYNIGFGSPASDVCSTCLSYGERIKAAEGNDKSSLKFRFYSTSFILKIWLFSAGEENKSQLEGEFQIHKKRAAAFFEYLRDKDDDLFLCYFDCEKNIALPKVPDGPHIILGSSTCIISPL